MKTKNLLTDLSNIRLHRNDSNKEESFYWDITTGKKVAASRIPQLSFVPEQQKA